MSEAVGNENEADEADLTDPCDRIDSKLAVNYNKDIQNGARSKPVDKSVNDDKVNEISILDRNVVYDGESVADDQNIGQLAHVNTSENVVLTSQLLQPVQTGITDPIDIKSSIVLNSVEKVDENVELCADKNPCINGEASETLKSAVKADHGTSNIVEEGYYPESSEDPDRMFKFNHENTCEVVNFGDLDDKLVLHEDGDDDNEDIDIDVLPMVTRDMLFREPEMVHKEQDFIESEVSNKVDQSYEPVLKSAWTSANGKTYKHNGPFSNLSTKMSLNDNSESYFFRLPNELCLKVFSYLTNQEVCQHVAPVCRRWKQFSRDQSLWKYIDFSKNPNISSLNLLWVIREAPLLLKLRVSGRTNITRAEVAILTETCSDLQDINFGFCDDLNSEMLQCLSENCLKLKKINVEGCLKVEHRSIRYLARCKNLTHLNFSHCNLEDTSLKYLSDNLDMIKSINLDGISFFTDSGVIAMVTKHAANLEEIQLDGAEISDESFKHLATCTRLRVLGMSFCELITDQALVYIKEIKSLECLKLRKGVSFTQEGLVTFFHEASLHHLYSLNLSECTCLDDTGVLEMAKACGRGLRELMLSWCWYITDRGLISIMDHCCNLVNLDLIGIDKITGSCLDRIPEEMPYLKLLELQQCNKIVDSLIIDVVRDKPDLKVINYYGEEFVY